MKRYRHEILLVVFLGWATLVTAAFFHANAGYFLSKLAERGLLP